MARQEEAVNVVIVLITKSFYLRVSLSNNRTISLYWILKHKKIQKINDSVLNSFISPTTVQTKNRWYSSDTSPCAVPFRIREDELYTCTCTVNHWKAEAVVCLDMWFKWAENDWQTPKGFRSVKGIQFLSLVCLCVWKWMLHLNSTMWYAKIFLVLCLYDCARGTYSIYLFILTSV